MDDEFVKLSPADKRASTVSLPLSLTFLGILAANHVQPCIGGELSKLLFSDSIFFINYCSPAQTGVSACFPVNFLHFLRV